MFGLFDLLFGAPQAICLYLAWRRTRDERLGRKPGGGLVVTLMILATLAIFAAGFDAVLPGAGAEDFRERRGVLQVRLDRQ